MKQKSILEYLKSLPLEQSNLDIQVKGVTKTGSLHVRGGQLVAAECGNLQGNGALLTLVSIGTGDVWTTPSENPVKRTVSVSVLQIARFFANLPSFSYKEGACDEDQAFEEAIQLFFQFRRKEAGAKLVALLRHNRFYYPAWLWHSRLMTRVDYIKKSLTEAKKWGNADSLVLKEVKKIEPQLKGSSGTVRRCIFCWSLVEAGEESCDFCRGLQRVSNSNKNGRPVTDELRQAVSFYEEEMKKNPRNSRIAYCLCLGYCSFGQVDRAKECVNEALAISPKEPLFIKASEILRLAQEPLQRKLAEKTPAPQPRKMASPAVAYRPSTSKVAVEVDKTVLVVEDSKTARKVVSMVLGRKGYKTIEATTGTEALLAIEGVTPDLVLLDVMLPDMSGYDILSSIRKNSELSEIPVVMLTGKRSSADRQKGIVGGANEYLTKPFNPAKLLGVLGKYLNSSGKTDASTQPKYIKKVPASPVSVEVTDKTKEQAVVATVPVAMEKSLDKSPVTAKQAESLEAPKGVEKSVLVIEDSPTSRKVITMVLSRNGYVVAEAATGGEALRKVREVLPQLILLDAMLPDMTGYDILDRLKQDPQLKEIPVVMLTAKNSPVDREKGLRAGSAAYLTKPFNPDKLLSVIGRYI